MDRADERQELERLKHGVGGKRRRPAAAAASNRNTAMLPPTAPRLSLPVLPRQMALPAGPLPNLPPPQRPLPGPDPPASPPATLRVRRASFAPGSTPPWGQQLARREIDTASVPTPEEGTGKKARCANDAMSEETPAPDEGRDRDNDEEGDEHEDLDDDDDDDNYDDDDDEDDDDRSDERDEFSEDDE